MTPTAKSVLGPLQKAIYDRLHGDTALTALAGVHDHVPEDVTGNYVVIGDGVENPDNTHDGFGRDTTITLHVWTPRRGYADASAIVDRIVALLDHQEAALTLPGHRVIAVYLARAQPLRDPDPKYRHVPVAFRVLTEQEM